MDNEIDRRHTITKDNSDSSVGEATPIVIIHSNTT